MNGKLKRSLAERVRRSVTNRLADLGFSRTKTTFWTRPRGPVVEFVHLHLFSFMPAFRVHIGVRVLNDPFEAIALNGPNSEQDRRYDHSFAENSASLVRCAEELERYCMDIGEPWWAARRPPERLLRRGTKLDPEASAALGEALAGRIDQARVARSRSLLGVA
jgi:hypothetical protein